jgi:hypothetical protein
LLAISLKEGEEGGEKKRKGKRALPFEAQGKRAVPLRETDLRVVRLMAW